MKALLVLLIVVSTVIFSACQESKTPNQNTALSSKNTKDSVQLEILYFHSTHRCPTCNSIESNIKTLVETEFKPLVDRGLIDFKVINIDLDSNRAMAEIYEAFGSTLILVEHQNGQEKEHNFTDFAFSYSRNEPQKFLREMNDTIKSMTNP